eukprot:2591916-Prymnesium_polylepis.1
MQRFCIGREVCGAPRPCVPTPYPAARGASAQRARAWTTWRGSPHTDPSRARCRTGIGGDPGCRIQR